MKLERLQLFSIKKEFLNFILVCSFILSYSLLIEYNNYKNLTKFDSNIVTATLIKQYNKIKTTKNNKTKTYQILKLKADKGFVFYTSQNKNFPHIKGGKIKLEIWAGKINFYQYMSGFFSYSKVLHLYKTPSLKEKLNSYISTCHRDKNISQIYQALYTATQPNKELQKSLSSLGISHLVAISGFHLGVLSFILFFIFKIPYKFLQNRYFPYRSYKLDSYIFIIFILGFYLIFLDYPASLIRAFVMLIVMFVLYDRHIQIFSMQTLFLTAILILSFFPRLLFSLGFWLSIAGVFYIFLFFIYFKHLNKIWYFILIPFWVYLFMLPFSLVIFSNFSIYHPLSVLWSILFTLFYPVSIFLHLIGFADLFDKPINILLGLNITQKTLNIPTNILFTHIVLSFIAVFRKKILWVSFIFCIFILIYAIKNVT